MLVVTLGLFVLAEALWLFRTCDTSLLVFFFSKESVGLNLQYSTLNHHHNDRSNLELGRVMIPTDVSF